MTVPDDLPGGFRPGGNMALHVPHPRDSTESAQLRNLLPHLTGPVLVAAAAVLPPFGSNSPGISVIAARANHYCRNAEELGIPSGTVPSGIFVVPDAERLLEALEGLHHPRACQHPGSETCAAVVAAGSGSRRPPQIWSGHATSTPLTLPSMGFNRVHVAGEKVVKSGEMVDKIRAEYEWFTKAPGRLRHLLPQAGPDRAESAGEFSYHLPLIDDATVGEKLVFARLPQQFWDAFFTHAGRALDELSAPLPGQEAVRFSETYLGKTTSRLAMLTQREREMFAGAQRLNGRVIPGLDAFAQELPDRLSSSGLLSPRQPGYVHGDLFAGNMFFTPEAGLTLIDPRGSFPEAAVGGDPLYELLKLSQSLLGRYDAAWFGRFDLRMDPEGWQATWGITPSSEKAYRAGTAWIMRAWAERSGLSAEALQLGTAVLLISAAALQRPSSLRALLLLQGLSLLR